MVGKSHSPNLHSYAVPQKGLVIAAIIQAVLECYSAVKIV